MRLFLEFQHPHRGTPKGKRKDYFFYTRGTLEFEVPMVTAAEVEFVASYERGTDTYSVYRSGGDYYTTTKERITAERLQARASASLDRRASSIAVHAYSGAGSEFLPPQSLFTSQNVISKLPVLPEELGVRECDPALTVSMNRMLERFSGDYLLLDGEVLERCEQPRLELVHDRAGHCTVSLTSGEHPPLGADVHTDYSTDRKFPVAYFRIEREAEAFEFARSVYGGGVERNYTALVLGDAEETEELDHRSLQVLAVRLEKDIRAGLVGNSYTPVFAAGILDSMSAEAIQAYRALRSVALRLINGETLDGDLVADHVEAVMGYPELVVDRLDGLPTAELVAGWYEREVSLSTTPGLALA